MIPQDNLIRKYNVPGPRYTSYPPVPFWTNDGHNQHSWLETVRNTFWLDGKEISIYIHLPFCDSLCTYCGCSTHITRNHKVEREYIDALLKEWSIYFEEFGTKPNLKELHLGGGTPTFFSPSNLEYLIGGILKNCNLSDQCALSFEGHPKNTSYDHLKTLGNLGFKRVSFGIQDFDRHVQEIINRKQTYQEVEQVTNWAKELGYAVNYDLVYGLPAQNLSKIRNTIEKTIALRPDRIAFYGYAHVPQLKPAQKSFEHLLPIPENRFRMYELGKQLFTEGGYLDIGMDHFALPSDEIVIAKQNGKLHRNFMGYTTQKTELLIGLGMTSISDSWTAFSQNEKKLKDYYSKLDQGLLPITKGHRLTQKDLYIRQRILDLMCNYKTQIDQTKLKELGVEVDMNMLQKFQDDGLINYENSVIDVTKIGEPFVRNICMAVDPNFVNKMSSKSFSKVV